MRAVEILKEIRILMSDKPILSCGHLHQRSLVLGVLPMQIIDEYDGDLFVTAMKEPWKYCSLVLIPHQNPAFMKALNDEYDGKFFTYLYYNDDAWKSEFLKHYELVFQVEDSPTLVFKLRHP